MRARAGNHRSAGPAGFTLIEVMISMVVTAIAIMGLLAMFVTQTKAGAVSRHSTEAAILAADKIEKLRTMAPTAIAATTETSINERGVATGIFTRVYSQTLTNTYWADISVTVTWPDDGVSHTVTMKARRNR
jgi:prepilin-type N-terminal cleavage/methylation domain-containing protein